MKCVYLRMIVVNFDEQYPSGSILQDIASKEGVVLPVILCAF